MPGKWKTRLLLGEAPQGAESDYPTLEGFTCPYTILPDGSQHHGFVDTGNFCNLHIAILRQMDYGIATLTGLQRRFGGRAQR